MEVYSPLANSSSTALAADWHMEIGKTLYVKDRKARRARLARNHETKPEIWLIYYKKHTGKPRIPYDDAVEEALCFGWIDSIVKRVDDERTAQRFSPRRPNSLLSETNKVRILRLIAAGLMTEAGLAKVQHKLNDKFTIRPDILKSLKRDPNVWRNFKESPESYQRIRIGWIESARGHPDVFKTRLDYLIRMTGRNKMYGMVR